MAGKSDESMDAHKARSLEELRSLLVKLDSPAAGEKTAALQSLIHLFPGEITWHELDDETRTGLSTRLLDLLDATPQGDSPDTLVIKGIPFSLVLEAAIHVPDTAVRNRLKSLIGSDDKKIQEAVTRVQDKFFKRQMSGKNEGERRHGAEKEPGRVRGEQSEKLFVDSMKGESERITESGHYPSVRPDPRRVLMGRDGSSGAESFPGEPQAPESHPPGSSGAEPPGAPSPSGESLPAEPPAAEPSRAETLRKTITTPRRYVNTGFVSEQDSDHPISVCTPLKTASDYYFLFNIGKIAGWSIETKPGQSFPGVPEKTILHVAVFSPGEGISITQGADIGEVEIRGDGADVIRQPGSRTKDQIKSRHFSEWLFFPVSTPALSGQYQMRCAIYLNQILLQSRSITVQVQDAPEAWPKRAEASSSVLDYSISDTLLPEILNQMQEHRASLFFDIGTHGESRLYVFGSDGQGTFIKDDIVFQASELQNLIDSARTKLKEAAFREEPGKKPRYRYQGGAGDLDTLKDGLTSLAGWGHNFYYKMLTDFRVKNRAEFSGLLKEPSYIQIAMRENPQNFFPAAMIYDFPLRTGKKPEEYAVCEKFLSMLENKEDLKKISCFDNNCIAKNNPLQTTVCPMGFWGFRHSIGIPLSIKNDTIRSKIPVTDTLNIVVAASEELDSNHEHISALRTVLQQSKGPFKKAELNYASGMDDLLEKLTKSPHIVYFYCHGSESTGDIPVLKAGPVNRPFEIDPSSFGDAEISSWEKTHPLVFINGCHTGDIKPGKYLDFIEPLIVTHKASGVIGTEITIYPSMASVFARECFSSFIDGDPIGKAIRNARLEVLRNYNPLGLVYNPFAAGGLKLEKV